MTARPVPTSAVFAAAMVWLCAPLEAAEGLEVRLAGDRIRVSAPGLRFVSGPALDRLHNGAPVPFAIQLSLSTDRGLSVLVRDIQRFVLSYDLWEERFSVTRLGNPKKSQIRRTAREAETWCVDEMSLAPAAVNNRQTFWVKLEVRLENPGDRPAGDDSETISLSRLIDFFSRKTRGEQTRWVAEAGPLRLADLKKGADLLGYGQALLARLFR